MFSTRILKSIKYSILYILLIFIIIFLFVIFLKKKENFYEKKKYAVCVWGQLRGVKKTIDSFNKNLCQPLEADLFVICQKTNTETDKNLDLYSNVILKKLYENPENIQELYSFLCNTENNNNFCDDRHLNIYYNWYKISQDIGDILEKNYQYIILTRSDFLHLFPFPDVLNISQRSDIFWCYDGHEYDGVNATLICVPSIYIKEYLSIFYNYMNNPENNSQELRYTHIEIYIKIIFEYKKWLIGKMSNNALITADSINEITTTVVPFYSELKDIYYKYEHQFNDSYKSLDIYNNGGKWKYVIKDTPYLVLE